MKSIKTEHMTNYILIYFLKAFIKFYVKIKHSDYLYKKISN